MSIITYLDRLRSLQESLMTDTCRIVRDGIEIADDVPCRLSAQRLFTEPGDPSDANMRSMLEWAWTLPWDQDVQPGDYVELTDGSLSTIIGEVLNKDTWKVATRCFGTRPKQATPNITIALYRYQSGADDWILHDTFEVRIVYDRNAADETPVRYSPASSSRLKAGWVIGDLSFDPEVGDRFTIGGQAAYIIEVLPEQPQRVEAKFELDLGGVQ